ncbi:aminotransferase class IV [Actinokineospora diospyrosa]|uniref:Branched-chain amino acid aminotransferase/4-amino-4-deoxychorismate lyase n=1 Tax=Actinokineospora diospyrosa TaxID=103728 RepID=A0ABT1IK02_9PSEU|nr:aminotransferase class IV [Actinokineospora diospyrosa]MCP2272984.1 Branched-chain amino acid aminotransferase/4-amino-4-deoxychorismate lyase [Actinokineospora diospyrosa]
MSAQPDIPASLALVNYGHFTSMLLTAGRARGLSRHLERLDRDAWVVFGRGLDETVVRQAIRAAIVDVEGTVAVRVTVHAPGFDPRTPEVDVEPEVVVTTGRAPAVTGPLKVRTAGYQRDLPQVKHVGTFGLFYQRRLARRAGFDDVLFIGPDGLVSEGSTWNVCFLDQDDTFVVPTAPALPGIALGLIQGGLARLGAKVQTRPVSAADLPGFRAAFATNALQPVRAISHIDDVEYKVDDAATARLLKAHDLTAAERA